MTTISYLDQELASLLSCTPEQSAEDLAAYCQTYVPTVSSVQLLADACREC
jgi:hypothetical protein